MMKAAVVEDVSKPPRYADFAEPSPGAGDVLVNVRAAGLSQLVRAQAAGKHYSSAAGASAFVPGTDGVGTLADGRRVYFAFPKPSGSMAERAAVRREFVVVLPDEIDDATAAAAANPGMSSWAALTRRAHFSRGESVLINGATGTSGKLAIAVARHLGASRIIATGRNADALATLAVDDVVPLAQPQDALVADFKRAIGQGVDIVLDYVYGESAEAILAALLGHAPGTAAPRTRFVNIGSMGGATITLPAAALRSSGLELLGSGLGASSNEALIGAIGEFFHAFVSSRMSIDAQPVPLADVARVWPDKTSDRVVFTM